MSSVGMLVRHSRRTVSSHLLETGQRGDGLCPVGLNWQNCRNALRVFRDRARAEPPGTWSPTMFTR